MSYNYHPGSCAAQFSVMKKAKRGGWAICGTWDLKVSRAQNLKTWVVSCRKQVFTAWDRHCCCTFTMLQSTHTWLQKPEGGSYVRVNTLFFHFLFSSKSYRHRAQQTASGWAHFRVLTEIKSQDGLHDIPAEPFLFHFQWFRQSLCYFRDMRLRGRLSCLVPENMEASFFFLSFFFLYVWGEKQAVFGVPASRVECAAGVV